MKTKSFNEYLEKRLSKEQIAELKQKAYREAEILRSFQRRITNSINDYMKKEGIGFNELVRRLSISPSQALKIKKGQANLTLASLAHLFASLGEEAKDLFKN
jgi:DNA-binding protein H-NS